MKNKEFLKNHHPSNSSIPSQDKGLVNRIEPLAN
jgi:hypothetical protein